MNPDLMADLDAFGVDPINVDDDPPVVTDPAHAERLLRRLARLEADESEVAAVASAERDRIEAWREDRTTGILRAKEWVQQALHGYALHQFQTNGTKTIDLPNGTLRLRAASGTSVALDTDHDVDAFPEDAVVTKRSVSRSAAAKVLQPGPVLSKTDTETTHAAVNPETGEVLDGVTLVVKTGQRFSVKVAS